jgi:hypothetical protein
MKTSEKLIWRRLVALYTTLDLLLRRLVTGAALTSFYLLVLTPLALLFRLMGRDALRLRRCERVTYWTARPDRPNFRNYFRSC